VLSDAGSTPAASTSLRSPAGACARPRRATAR